MKRLTNKFSGFLLLCAVLVACSDPLVTPTSTSVGDWRKLADFGGRPRNGAVSFTVNGRVFVGTGFDGTTYLNDFYEFIPGGGDFGTWFRRADMPGGGRNKAVAFSAHGKGYVGTGYDGKNRLNDFWSYDPDSDTWTQVASLPSQTTSGQSLPAYRFDATSFSLNDRGYVGLGFGYTNSSLVNGNELSDWWEYDPIIDKWHQKSFFPSKRINAFSFVVDGKAYVGGGTSSGVYSVEFYEYNPENDSWNKKRDIGNNDDQEFTYNIQRASPATFVINSSPYITLGNTGGLRSDTWLYDYTSDTWTETTPFEGNIREDAIGFSLGSKGFVTTGRSGTSLRFDDTWEFDPEAEFQE